MTLSIPFYLLALKVYTVDQYKKTYLASNSCSFVKLINQSKLIHVYLLKTWIQMNTTK